MSALDNPKALFQSTCSTNSEPYALQNIGDMMSPEFSENCIIIVDPGMPVHNKAYVIIDFNDELYFRQFILEDDEQLLRCSMLFLTKDRTLAIPLLDGLLKFWPFANCIKETLFLTELQEVLEVCEVDKVEHLIPKLFKRIVKCIGGIHL